MGSSGGTTSDARPRRTDAEFAEFWNQSKLRGRSIASPVNVTEPRLVEVIQALRYRSEHKYTLLNEWLSSGSLDTSKSGWYQDLRRMWKAEGY
jgi:hypothetical protein